MAEQCLSVGSVTPEFPSLNLPGLPLSMLLSLLPEAQRAQYLGRGHIAGLWSCGILRDRCPWVWQGHLSGREQICLGVGGHRGAGGSAQPNLPHVTLTQARAAGGQVDTLCSSVGAFGSQLLTPLPGRLAWVSLPPRIRSAWRLRRRCASCGCEQHTRVRAAVWAWSTSA